MTSASALLGLCGLGTAAGILLIIHGMRRVPSAGSSKPPRWLMSLRREEHAGRWLVAAATVGVLAGALTGWLVGAVLAALATWGLPRAVAPDRAHQRRVARIEAVAGWAEMLRDTLAAAAGLEQTIVATAHTAPEAIRPQVRELAAQLEEGKRLTTALRRFADDISDPLADLVVAVLVLAAEHQGRQLAPLLGQLAETARAQVEMRRRVDAGRAKMRTTVRVIVATTLFFALGLVALNRAFLEPYDSATGQLVLLLVGAVFTAAFAWLRRLMVVDEPARFLTGLDAVPVQALGETEADPREVRP